MGTAATLVTGANVQSPWSHSTVNLAQPGTGKGQRKWRICGSVVLWQISLVWFMNFVLESGIADGTGTWSLWVCCCVYCMAINCNSKIFGRYSGKEKVNRESFVLLTGGCLVWMVKKTHFQKSKSFWRWLSWLPTQAINSEYFYTPSPWINHCEQNS